jgi:hypothetical protein
MRLLTPLEALENSIIARESGGNINAVHPLVKTGRYAGQRAIGLGGIMPGNVPAWSREHLGREMTPAELAADEKAQRAIIRGELQKNLTKYGNPQDAASVWFTGRPFAQASAAGANDSFTSVQDYVAKVTGGVPTRSVPTSREGPSMPMQNPYGGLGGLGGYQPPTGMQNFGDILSALGMSLLSSPSNNMFQNVPQTMMAMQGRRGKEADAAREAGRWNAEFGLKSQDLEARRAEQAIDNARQERALKLQESNATRSGNSAAYNTTLSMYPNLKPGSPEFLEKYKEVSRAGGSGETFGAPTFVNREGKSYAVQYGSQGSVKEAEVKGDLSKPEQVTRLGTKVRIRNADGTISYEDIDVAGEAGARAEGKLTGEQRAAAPGNIARITAAREELKRLRDDPNRESSTGWQGVAQLHRIPLTPQATYASRLNKAKAGAYLEGIQALQGFGPVTEKEGAAAARAKERMSLALTDEEYLVALNDYDQALEQGLQKAQQALQGRNNPAPMTPRPGGASSPNRRRYDANGNPM